MIMKCLIRWSIIVSVTMRVIVVNVPSHCQSAPEKELRFTRESVLTLQDYQLDLNKITRIYCRSSAQAKLSMTILSPFAASLYDPNYTGGYSGVKVEANQWVGWPLRSLDSSDNHNPHIAKITLALTIDSEITPPLGSIFIVTQNEVGVEPSWDEIKVNPQPIELPQHHAEKFTYWLLEDSDVVFKVLPNSNRAGKPAFEHVDRDLATGKQAYEWNLLTAKRRTASIGIYTARFTITPRDKSLSTYEMAILFEIRSPKRKGTR